MLDESFEWVPPQIEDEIPGAVDRALKTGAQPPLRYLGAGATGIVICDRNDIAYKVARHWPSSCTERLLFEESVWFEFASQLPAIQQHVARVIGYEPINGVLVRECVMAEKPGSAGWSPKREQRRLKLFERIVATMRPYGFRKPEYKSDSFVYHPKRGPVLVDAGFAKKDLGWANARRARQLLAGAIPEESWEPQAVAFGLRSDAGSLLPWDIAWDLATKLRRKFDFNE